MGFSRTKTIQLLGYPHDYGNPQVFLVATAVQVLENLGVNWDLWVDKSLLLFFGKRGRVRIFPHFWKNIILFTHHVHTNHVPTIEPTFPYYFPTIFPSSNSNHVSHNCPIMFQPFPHHSPITSQKKKHHLRHVLQRAHAAHHRHNRCLKQRGKRLLLNSACSMVKIFQEIGCLIFLTWQICRKTPNPVVQKMFKHLKNKDKDIPC